MRLSKTQIKFMDSIYVPEYITEYYECFEGEIRTANSLYKKGLIEFDPEYEPVKGCEWFMARLTSKGIEFLTKLKEIK